MYKFFISFFVLVSFLTLGVKVSYADIIHNCLFTGTSAAVGLSPSWAGTQDGATSGFTGTGDYTYSESFSGSGSINGTLDYNGVGLDCVSYDITKPVSYFISLDRNEVHFLSNVDYFGLIRIFDVDGNIVFDASLSSDYFYSFSISDVSLPDGVYTLSGIINGQNQPFYYGSLYISNQMFYLDFPVILSEGINGVVTYRDWITVYGIIIFILSILVMGVFMWPFKKKKNHGHY